MKPIKISIDVNVNLPENVQNFFEALFASMTSNTPVNQVVADNFDPAQAPAAPAAPTASAAPAALAAPTASAAPASSLTIEDVRKVLSEKVNDHRAEIKQKLSDLGAPSVTKLEPSKYQEMYDFLKSL